MASDPSGSRTSSHPLSWGVATTTRMKGQEGGSVPSSVGGSNALSDCPAVGVSCSSESPGASWGSQEKIPSSATMAATVPRARSPLRTLSRVLRSCHAGSGQSSFGCQTSPTESAWRAAALLRRDIRSCAEGSRGAERRMASSLSLRNFSQTLSGSVGSGAVTVPAHLPSGRIRGPADGRYVVPCRIKCVSFTPGRRSGDRPSARLPHTIIAQCKMRSPVYVPLHGEALPALEPLRIWLRRVHEIGNAPPGLGEVIVARQEEGAAGYGSLHVSGEGVT